MFNSSKYIFIRRKFCLKESVNLTRLQPVQPSVFRLGKTGTTSLSNSQAYRPKYFSNNNCCFYQRFFGILSPILYLLLKIIVTGIAGVKKIFQDHDKNQCNHLHGGRKILEGRNNFSLGLHAEISVQVVLGSSQRRQFAWWLKRFFLPLSKEDPSARDKCNHLHVN